MHNLHRSLLGSRSWIRSRLGFTTNELMGLEMVAGVQLHAIVRFRTHVIRNRHFADGQAILVAPRKCSVSTHVRADG